MKLQGYVVALKAGGAIRIEEAKPSEDCPGPVARITVYPVSNEESNSSVYLNAVEMDELESIVYSITRLLRIARDSRDEEKT